VKYAAPSTIEETSELLAANPGARVFAGATDMLPQAKAGRALPELLIDLKRIPRLVETKRGDEWVIGAATPAATVTADPEFRADFPGIAEGFALIGSDQIQNRASLGGNLCNASPAADTGPAMVVNDARAVIASRDGMRTIPVAELMVGPGRTSLGEDEFVVEFLIERPESGRSDAYLRMTPRTEMDIAVVGAAARVTLDEAGVCTGAAVALGAVAPTVVEVDGIADALRGRVIDDDALDEIASLSRAVCRPIDDKRGTKEYRTHVAGVLAKRAMSIAVSRAGGTR
jgi:CO/xanthine dehydrogenase FAD-binding subunit